MLNLGKTDKITSKSLGKNGQNIVLLYWKNGQNASV